MEKNNKSFTLNKINYYFIFAYLAIALILFVLFNEASGYSIGRVFGRFLATMFLSIIAGYVCWLISIKNERVGAWGFNISVLVITAYLLLSYYKLAQNREAKEQYLQAENEFYELMKNDDVTAEQIESSYDEFQDTMFNSIAKQVENADGKAKEALMIQQAYLKEFAPIINKWQTSFDEFTAKDVLDPSMLKSDPVVYQNRVKLIDTLIDDTKTYKTLINGMENTIRERLLPLDFSQKQLNKMVANFVYSPRYSVEDLDQTLNALIAYLDDSKAVLNLLNDNQDKWFEEGSQLVIEDDELLAQYNTFVETLWQKETRVQELFARIFK